MGRINLTSGIFSGACSVSQRKYLEESNKASVTPMESAPESANMHFVRKLKEQMTGRMKWKDGYDRGRQGGACLVVLVVTCP